MRFVDKRTLVGIEHDSSDPVGVDRLQKIYQHGLGYRLYESVDAAKVALSIKHGSNIVCPSLDLDVPLSRTEFEAYIQPEMREIAQVVTETLARAQKQSNQVKTVILTGGTSQTPIVQELIRRQFARSDILFPDPIATVGGGLALRAAELNLGPTSPSGLVGPLLYLFYL
jgi:hypothetical chaperone protein